MKRWRRNFYHLGFGLLFPVGYYFGHRQGAVILISCLFVLFLVFEIVRFKHQEFNKWVFKYLSPLIKTKERFQPTGTTFFLFGVLVAIISCPHHIVVASLTFLAISDVAAAVVGERWGRIKILNKTLEGGISFFVTALLVGMALLHLPRMQMEGLNFRLIAWGALVAALVELFSYKIDDNLTVPIITSLVMKIIS